ncbi:hypothetical protein Goklo_019767 [Gossypium klotzschianum]|uniref:non-specific serine/threonine protein kinase n=1 Tax=Gossypium klotzschianum TaxID=34286 RepID=A0A7J8UQ76_9ROSI|nr:hypothetical protein [Gossypium klotzschianum]
MHPHIIRLYEVIETTTKIFIVTEYAASGDLFDYIVQKRRLKEDEARKLFQQIISGVEYCHRCMVVHRDLKPENLLLDSNFNVKIADFGFSNIMRDGHFLKTSCGSPNYAAPEIVSGKLYAGPEVDAWSCGVILYALLSGTLPFEDESFHNLYKKIKASNIKTNRHLSAGARDLISRIIVVDPMKRLTIPEIRQHPWFQAHLPIYLAVPRPDTTQQAKKVDEEILQEVVRMGFEKNHLVESLRNRVQNEGTVAYYLLLDNRFGVPSGNLGAEFQETMETTSFNPPNPIEAAAPGVGHSLPGYTDNQAMDLRSPERKWALGLQSGGQPFQIMMEVLKALQAINVRWKNIGHYNMKCRWLPSFIPGLNNNHYFGDDESTVIENSGVTKSPNVVKFQLQVMYFFVCLRKSGVFGLKCMIDDGQLYKTEEEKYVVDVQRLEGPQFLFLDVCAALHSFNTSGPFSWN